MITIRRIETVAGALYKAKDVRGFCHLYSGQEAVAVGMKAAMRAKDSIITAYRSHGWSYLMGISPLGVLAELTGRQKGCSRGKGGSMHMYAPNFYGGNGIVGAQVPLGAGVALASQYTGNGGVCLTCYGDGAANQGQVFEAYNMAQLWKLPCIFVCENNGYAMGTSVERSSMNPEFFTRGDVIPGLWIDGMDLLSVRNGTEFAIDHALNKGPIVIEANTYRYYGHSMSDPGVSYRSREEIDEVRKSKDPITTFKEQMIKSGILTEEETKSLESKIKAEINEVGEEAKKDKELELKHMWSDIYLNNLTPKIRGILDYDLTHELHGKPFISPTKLDTVFQIAKADTASQDAKAQNSKSDKKDNNEKKASSKTAKEDSPKENAPKENSPKKDPPKNNPPKEDQPKGDPPKSTSPKKSLSK